MNSYRYNPVYKKWYLIGAPIIEPEKISKGMILDPSNRGDFLAASYPRELFVLDAPSKKDFQLQHTDVLHLSNPPLGEYDLLLYKGGADFWNFTSGQWEKLLEQLQLRILAVHKNLAVQYLDFTLSTKLLYSFQGYLRVGDLVGASHQIFEDYADISFELAEKLKAETLFEISQGKHGRLYAPCAPKYNKEVWYISNKIGGFESASTGEVVEVASYLAKLISFLRQEWIEENWTIKLHTSINASREEMVWWFQIYQDNSNQSSLIHGILPQRLNPEGYVHLLKKLF